MEWKARACNLLHTLLLSYITLLACNVTSSLYTQNVLVSVDMFALHIPTLTNTDNIILCTAAKSITHKYYDVEVANDVK